MSVMKQINDFFKTFASIVGPLAYAIGYLIWGANSYKNNLGFLPALSMQYFVSGLIPAAYLVSTVCALFFLEKWVGMRLETNTHKFLNDVTLGFVAMSLAPVFVLAIASLLGASLSNFGLWLFAYIILTIATALIAVYSFSHAGFRRSLGIEPGKFRLKYLDNFIDWLDAGLKYAGKVSVGFMIISLSTFFFNIYFQAFKYVPQSFGGFQPRKALLVNQHIDTTQAAFQLLQNRGTIDALVYFKSSDKVMFKLSNDSQKVTYEMDVGNFSVIRWAN